MLPLGAVTPSLAVSVVPSALSPETGVPAAGAACVCTASSATGAGVVAEFRATALPLLVLVGFKMVPPPVPLVDPVEPVEEVLPVEPPAAPVLPPEAPTNALSVASVVVVAVPPWLMASVSVPESAAAAGVVVTGLFGI